VKDFVYEINFPEKTTGDKDFVEDLWARRKVGFLLDQIRVNGEKKELVEEVVVLAKRYGITTPYTSYLIVPDAAVPVVRERKPKDGKPDVGFHLPPAAPPVPEALKPAATSAAPVPVADFLKQTPVAPTVATAPPGFGGGAGIKRMAITEKTL